MSSYNYHIQVAHRPAAEPCSISYHHPQQSQHSVIQSLSPASPTLPLYSLYCLHLAHYQILCQLDCLLDLLHQLSLQALQVIK